MGLLWSFNVYHNVCTRPTAGRHVSPSGEVFPWWTLDARRPPLCPAMTSGSNGSLIILRVFPLLQNQTKVRADDVIGEGPAWGEAPHVISLRASLCIPNSIPSQRRFNPNGLSL
jgi:hypothetical protein